MNGKVDFSLQELLELSAALSGKPYSLKKEMQKRGIKLGGICAVAIMAMPMEILAFMEERREFECTIGLIMDFIFRDADYPTISGYLFSDSRHMASRKELVLRIVDVISKPIWADDGWLSAIENHIYSKRSRFIPMFFIRKVFIETAAVVEVTCALEKSLRESVSSFDLESRFD